MKREEHEQRSIEMFGKPFPEVHEFLDQYFAMFGPYHRIVLHHRKGLELLNQQIPGPVRKVAEQHIIDDLGRIPDGFWDHDGPIKMIDHVFSKNTRQHKGRLIKVVCDLYPDQAHMIDTEYV